MLYWYLFRSGFRWSVQSNFLAAASFSATVIRDNQTDAANDTRPTLVIESYLNGIHLKSRVHELIEMNM